jgi:hypothetical protein
MSMRQSEYRSVTDEGMPSGIPRKVSVIARTPIPCLQARRYEAAS